MIDLDIRSNIKEFEKMVGKFKNQIPFATKNAINETSKGARAEVVNGIKNRQKSGKAWWNSKTQGINRTYAEKNKLAAMIYTPIYFAKLQEYGGTKKPHNSQKISIPTTNTPKSRRKAGGAKLMLQQGRTFFASMASGKSGIWRRKTKKRLPIQLLYSLAETAIIDKPYLFFKKTIDHYVRKNFPANHLKQMEKAILTAKK